MAATYLSCLAPPLAEAEAFPRSVQMSNSTTKDELRRQLNLKNLQRHDPSIDRIVASTSYASIYDNKGHGWVKTGVEGPMFLFSRSAFPTPVLSPVAVYLPHSPPQDDCTALRLLRLEPQRTRIRTRVPDARERSPSWRRVHPLRERKRRRSVPVLSIPCRGGNTLSRANIHR